MHLRIGGFTIQLASREPDLNLVLNPATARFAVEPSSPDVRIEVGSGDLVDDGAGDLIFDSGGPWRLFRHGDGYLFHFFSSLFGPVPYKTVRWNADFTRGRRVSESSALRGGRACRSTRVSARRTAHDQPARARPGPGGSRVRGDRWVGRGLSVRRAVGRGKDDDGSPLARRTRGRDSER